MLHENLESLFKRWLVEHDGAVLKVARAYTLSAEDCQDLAQEILLQVWRSLPQFQGRANAATWFYRVALNTALGKHRKEHRRRTHQQLVFEVEDLSVAGSVARHLEQRRGVVEQGCHATSSPIAQNGCRVGAALPR